MRADRLVAVLLLMQSRGRVTAAEVAEELEVSVATARRDLEALSTAGIPVYPQSGRGGGWSLLGGARTDLSGLTATEAQALFLLVGPAAAVAPEAKAALRKLVRALPDTFRPTAEAAANAVVIDPATWGDPDRQRPVHLGSLQSAVIHRRQVHITYQDRRRLVDPWGLIDKHQVWYLIAGTPNGRRTFRLDRVTGVEPTDLPGDRPDDFDLAQAWDEVVAEMEQRRSTVAATVLIEERYVRVLRDQFGRHCEVEAIEPDGRARVRVAAHMPIGIAQHLAGWGALVEVVDSEPVKAELARLGTELVARYVSG
ncbi:helix-turn-helix transcriptional regulator [Actinocrispum wychmicini]|uniref:Putative DNA-binding transcriptional regulator YafY n=1 Tax=Actinocrispum wychmicini TaxID=1213861 RepID=A0A4R2J7D4_9PSEU|nr:WYL domain-containing protein [Actinocrispum wychmicini]TCO55001.1 putative DNA-binding transcriptional regulator YafY [Actinocrispum wychmicini]